MQVVSSGWIANQENTIVSESFIEVSHKVAPPTAQSTAEAQSASDTAWSNLSGITEEQTNVQTYYGLDLNMWVLDGKEKNELPTSDYGNTGFVSEELSGPTGEFSTAPIIELVWDETQTEPLKGISILWSEKFDEFATSVTVTAYNNGVQVANAEMNNNKNIESIVYLDAEQYSRITVSVNAWCTPYNRAKIENITIGVWRTYTKEDLFSYSYEASANLLSGTLPESKISFSINNTMGDFNPDYESGDSAFLAEQQEVRVRYGYKINNQVEWISGGRYYLSSWKIPSNGISVNLVATSAIDWMRETYTTSFNGTAYDCANTVIQSSSLPIGTNVYLSSSLRNANVSIPENQNLTAADILQLCANAGQCVIYVDRDGDIRIEPHSSNVTDYNITMDNSFTFGEYVIAKPVKTVLVNDIATLGVNATGVEERITNGIVSDVTTANGIAKWVANTLQKRKTISGEWRSDPRVDVLDTIVVTNKYGQNTIVLTDVKFVYNGGFRGEYDGRVLYTSPYYGDLYASDDTYCGGF